MRFCRERYCGVALFLRSANSVGVRGQVKLAIGGQNTSAGTLFCNVFGKQLVKSTCYHMLYDYNKSRGVETTGIHRYRHTFAKQWILGGGNVVSLSRLLGHSNLSITQNYINLLVCDLSDQVDEMNILDKFAAKKYIKM